MLGRLLERGESRAVTRESFFFGDDIPTSWSSQSVSQTNALKVSTVYACVRLYVDTISTLPVGAFVRDNGARVPAPRPDWLAQPYPGVSWPQHVQQGMWSLLTSGNWYTRVYRNAIGEPVALLVLDPARVEPQAGPDGGPVYVVDGGAAVLDRRDVLHITELLPPGKLKGVSRIDQAAQELGLSQALLHYAAKFFANGTSLSGVIETPATMTADQAKDALDIFERAHRRGNQHRPALLGGGARWVKSSAPPNEAQMLESREQAREQVAMIFKVPPHKIGITKPGSMSYSSVEQMQIAWVQDSLQPYVTLIENAYGWLLPRGTFLRLNLDALLRGDTATRFGAYAQGIDAGWLSINDVHRLEDLPPVPGGDQYRVGLENINLGAANVVETEKNVAMAVALIGAGADPAATLAAFGLPALPWSDHDSANDPNEPSDPADDMAEDMAEEDNDNG